MINNNIWNIKIKINQLKNTLRINYFSISYLQHLNVLGYNLDPLYIHLISTNKYSKYSKWNIYRNFIQLIFFWCNNNFFKWQSLLLWELLIPILLWMCCMTLSKAVWQKNVEFSLHVFQVSFLFYDFVPLSLIVPYMISLL